MARTTVGGQFMIRRRFLQLIWFPSVLVVGLKPSASSPIPPPPSLSMPVWSLACPSSHVGDENHPPSVTTSMNIITYAMPVSIASPKLWAVALYHDTLTKDSFLKCGTGILQLLTPSHANLVPLLGKQSGYDTSYSKQDACEQAGWKWIDRQDNNCILSQKDDLLLMDRQHHVLPGCASYIQLKVLSTMDAGDHILAMTQVVQTGIWDDEIQQIVSVSMDTQASSPPPPPPPPKQPPTTPALDETTVLYTGRLRKDGIL